MTKFHGKNIVLLIGTTPSDTTLARVHGALNSVDFPRTNDEIDVTTFGAGDFRSFLSGFQGATLRISGFWDDTAISGSEPAGNGGEKFWHDWSISGTEQRRFRFAPSGTTSGKAYYEGTAIILGFSINGAVQNAIAFSSDLRVTGSVTRATF